MPTILIVDDEPPAETHSRACCRIEGYEITQAADGLEALQRLDEQTHDLILLDLLMPRMDGVTFLERMRADPRFNDLPVFLVTANHDPRMLRSRQGAGHPEYLFKGDVPFMRMLELIKKTLGEPYTPIRRGRRPKNPQAQPPDGPRPHPETPPIFDPFDEDDEPVDAPEFIRD